jgi:dTMP kinase
VSEPAGNVLHNRNFRKLWVGLGLSSLGDWLGLLALTAMANLFADSYAGKNYAIATVLLLRVLPPLLVGPVAGYVADRLDRRTTLVWGDFIRGALFVSIPLVGTLWWVFVVTVLVELVSVVWGPAKDATVPNLVDPRQLEQANQISLVTTYGSALPAAAIFAGLSFVDRVWPNLMGWLERGAVDLALYLNGLSFVVSGLVILGLHAIPRGPAAHGEESVWKVIIEGWSYVGRTPVVRGLVIGITGAFMAGGAVIGLARTLVSDLGGGDSGYALLFGAVFAGLGAGMWKGPGLLRHRSRTQVFGIALTATGVLLFPVALVPYLEVVVLVAVALGFCAGTAWVTGNTLLGLEVPDELRGRTFAFVGSLTKLALAAVLAVAPLVAGSIGTVEVGATYHGAAVTILLAGVLMSVVGAISYRQMHSASDGTKGLRT